MPVEVESRATKRNRTRSPAYPYIPLPAALEKAAVLWQVEGRHPAAVNVAMQHWGYKEDSSTGYSCVAALKKFGLVDHEGMGENRQVRLSGLALSILLDKNPDSPERRDALRSAALGPRIHAELWERYGHALPSDQSLRRFLVVERAFNEAAVDELLDEYKVTMAFAGLAVMAGGGANADEGTAARTPSAATTATPLPPSALAPATSGGGTQDRRQDGPALASRMPARTPSAPDGVLTAGAGFNGRKTAAVPTTTAQRQLFGEDDPAETEDAHEELPAPVNRLRDEAAAAAAREDRPAPWSMARRELPVPLDNGLVARVPYPMSEEDFLLLIDTLQLWKKRLVQPGR